MREKWKDCWQCLRYISGRKLNIGENSRNAVQIINSFFTQNVLEEGGLVIEEAVRKNRVFVTNLLCVRGM